MGSVVRVDLVGLPPEGKRLAGEFPGSVLELADDGMVSLGGAVHYDLKVDRLGDRLTATGQVVVEAVFCCSRCAESFRSTISDPGFLCVREVPEDAEFVDLTEYMRESILLNFPAHPVCSEVCRGLCPQCGINLNKGQCDCRPPTDSRWSELDALGGGPR